MNAVSDVTIMYNLMTSNHTSCN